MGSIHRPAPVKRFCALLLAPTVPLSDIETVLQQHFGTIMLRSQEIPFTQTTYYAREMGPALRRLYVAFDPLMAITELAPSKHTTNTLESIWADPCGQRRINLDPGYLDLAKVVLATTKDYAHRLYIGAGLFAEVTLRYQQQGFQPWEWTYPDYRLPETLDFFNRLRLSYKTQLGQSRAATT